jgi:hypothetical protein
LPYDNGSFAVLACNENFEDKAGYVFNYAPHYGDI